MPRSQLLDHSKVNTFVTSSKSARRERRESPSGSGGRQNLTGLGMISLTTEAQVDVLLEEVVEGMSILSRRLTVIRSTGVQHFANSNAHALSIHSLGTF